MCVRASLVVDAAFSSILPVLSIFAELLRSLLMNRRYTDERGSEQMRPSNLSRYSTALARLVPNASTFLTLHLCVRIVFAFALWGILQHPPCCITAQRTSFTVDLARGWRLPKFDVAVQSAYTSDAERRHTLFITSLPSVPGLPSTPRKKK